MAEQEYEVGGGNHAISVEVVSDACFRDRLHEKRKEIEEVTERHNDLCWPPLLDKRAHFIDKHKYNKDKTKRQVLASVVSVS